MNYSSLVYIYSDVYHFRSLEYFESDSRLDNVNNCNFVSDPCLKVASRCGVGGDALCLRKLKKHLSGFSEAGYENAYFDLDNGLYIVWSGDYESLVDSLNRINIKVEGETFADLKFIEESFVLLLCSILLMALMVILFRK